MSRWFNDKWRLATSGVVSTPPPTEPSPTPAPAPEPTPTGFVINSTLRVSDDPAAFRGTTGLKTWYDAYKNRTPVPGWAFMTSQQRQDAGNQVANNFRWEWKYVDGEAGKTYWTSHSHKDPNGVTYSYRKKGPDAPFFGQYSIVRPLAMTGLSHVNFALRGTQELRFLSLAGMDVLHAAQLQRDNGGIGTRTPDGYLGWGYGTNGRGHVLVDATYGSGTLIDNNGVKFTPDHRSWATIESRTVGGVSGQWLTYQNQWAGNTFGPGGPFGTEITLEDSVVAGQMVVGLAAHLNQDKFCPINEPVGNRPSTPQYFLKVRDASISIYENMRNKYRAWYDARTTPKKTLPMAIRRGILHGDLMEVVAAVAYAKIKGGADWRKHPHYIEAIRAWKLIAGPMTKFGAVHPNGTSTTTGGKAQHFQTTVTGIGECYFWAHLTARYEPSSKRNTSGEYIDKDSTGELISTSTSQSTHLTTYTRMTWSSFAFFFLEGCGPDFPGLDEIFMTRCANGVEAGMVKFISGGKMTKVTDGNGAYPTPNGWSRGGSGYTTGVSDAGMTSYFALAPWNAVVRSKNVDAYNLSGYKSSGAFGVEAVARALEEGKLAVWAGN